MLGEVKLRKNFFVLFVLFLIPLFILITNPEVKAQPTKSVEVGVLIISISNVDSSTNTYGMDFFLDFRFNSSEIDLEEIKEFIFLNSAVGSGPIQKNEILADEENGNYQIRVQGIFYGDFDYSNYPFDSQILPVVIEHKNLNASILSFKANPDSKIDEDVKIPGWNLSGFSVKVSEKSYYDSIFSQFVFSVEISRPIVSSIIKNALPLLIFLTMALSIYRISYKSAGERIAILTALLVAVIAFHLSITSGLSSGSYFTFFDEMMLSVYLIFLYNFSESIYVRYLFEQNQVEKAERVDKRAILVLILILILITIRLIFVF